MTTCPACERGEVVPVAKAGRFISWGGAVHAEVPADLALPTCTECGEEWFNREDAERFDAAMRAQQRRATVCINGTQHLAPVGEVYVRSLLRLAGVPAAHLLTRVAPGYLDSALGESATVHIAGGEEFFTCPRHVAKATTPKPPEPTP